MASRVATSRAIPWSASRSSPPRSIRRQCTSSKGVLLTALKPASTARRAASANPCGLRSRVPRLRFAYNRTESRRLPPSKRQAGTPSALPAKSHSAWSIALRAVAPTRPVSPEKIADPARHLFPQHLYLGRVRAHQPRPQLLQRGRDQAVVTALARFAQPTQPGVGVNLHEDPIAAMRRRYRMYSSNRVIFT